MNDDGFRLAEAGGLRLARCSALDDLPGVAHAFSTKRGPGDVPFDLGAVDEGSPEMRERRALWMQACGLPRQRPTLLRQVHGAALIEARPPATIDGVEADGVVAKRAARGSAPSVRWADCVPILLAATDGSALGAVHSGWRGAAAGIAGQAVERLRQAGVEPARLVAAIGPAIGCCCYEVGEEVARAVATASGVGMGAVTERVEPEGRRSQGRPGGRVRLDLRRAVAIQLERAGLDERRIRVAPWCTACSADLFFSHRRQGQAAGRQLATIGWS